MSELRQALKRLVQERYGGTVAKAARVVGVSQPALRGFLEGDTQAGVKILRGCAKLLPAEVAAEIGLPTRPSVALPNLSEAIEILKGRYSDDTIAFIRAAGAWFSRDIPLEEWIRIMRIYEKAHADAVSAAS